jgi:tetratricopeptide (TPR) repeat protein
MTLAAPTLDQLAARYLASAVVEEDASAEVEPYEVIGGFQPSPAELWHESRAAIRGGRTAHIASLAPPEWAAFVTHDSHGLDHVPATLTPFAAGLFPQRLRNFAALSSEAFLRTPAGVPRTPGFTGLRSWAAKSLRGVDLPAIMTASGVLAALGDHAEARAALATAEAVATPADRPALLNQRGCLAWLAGDTDAAKADWLAAGDFAPAQFNLGLYYLTHGEAAPAVECLSAAEETLPETSGWCHLARLFSALAG